MTARVEAKMEMFEAMMTLTLRLGRLPQLREMGVSVGISNAGHMRKEVERFERSGLVAWAPFMSPSYSVTDLGWATWAPVLGQLAGAPFTACQARVVTMSAAMLANMDATDALSAARALATVAESGLEWAPRMV